ncbi:hypothetical protein AAULH_14141, partial [Lactobacillus helveticus MTCC 5463]
VELLDQLLRDLRDAGQGVQLGKETVDIHVGSGSYVRDSGAR